jgi:hypothetical protein
MLLLLYEIETKIYDTEVYKYSSDVMFTSSFVKISHLVQKLKWMFTLDKELSKLCSFLTFPQGRQATNMS